MVNPSVNYRDRELTSLFGALADPVRRRMIQRLAGGPATIGELGSPFSITKPAISRHVRVLERAGLLRRTRDGRLHRCALRPESLARLEAWAEEQRLFWEGSLDRLAAYLDTTKTRSSS